MLHCGILLDEDWTCCYFAGMACLVASATWMLNSYDFALFLGAKTRSLWRNGTGNVSCVLVLTCLCVHSHVVCHTQVPCPAILLSQAAYMAAVSSGMNMQRAKSAPGAGLVVCTADSS